MQSATTAMQRRDARTAAQALEKALGLEPNNLEVNLLAGNFAAQTGQLTPAMECFKTVLSQSPAHFEALVGLSNVFLAKGEIAEALPPAERAVAVRPNDPVALNTLGLCLANLGRPEDAVTAFRKAIVAEPRVGAIQRNLGQVLERLLKDTEALACYQRAFQLDPADWQSRLSAAGLLMVHSRPAEALDQVQKVLQQDPNLVPAILLLARLRSELREPSLAEDAFRHAVTLSPDAKLSYGIWLMEEGRMSEADAFLEQFLAANPSHVLANYHLAEARRIKSLQDPIALRLQTLVDSNGLAADEAVTAHFGLGRILDRAKQYEQAIKHLDEGNRLAYRLHFAGGSNMQGIEAEVKYASEHFGQSELVARVPFANSSRRPIFIVGMIRSGTTLLEQIVSSHPDVSGAGELRFWLEHASEALSDRGASSRLAKEYLRILEKVDASSARVTDKAPLNYRLLGPIHATFPNAKILHIKRDPLDTCLSIYMMLHTKPPAFAHSQRNIVENYRLYEKMMDHWRSILPSSALLERFSILFRRG